MLRAQRGRDCTDNDGGDTRLRSLLSPHSDFGLRTRVYRSRRRFPRHPTVHRKPACHDSCCSVSWVNRRPFREECRRVWRLPTARECEEESTLLHSLCKPTHGRFDRHPTHRRSIRPNRELHSVGPVFNYDLICVDEIHRIMITACTLGTISLNLLVRALSLGSKFFG